MKKKGRINIIAVFLLAVLALCLAGCGGSKSNDKNEPPENGGPSVPITGPQHFEVIGMDGKLAIKFTGISAYNNTIQAKYDLRYGTSNVLANATPLGTEALKRNGVDPVTGDPKGPVEGEIDGLTNGQTYYVWINAVFDGVGESAYHMETGMPVPVPDAPSGVAATGYESMIEVTWDESEYASSYEVGWHTGTNPNSGQVVKMNTPETRFLITTRDLDGNPLQNNGTTYNIWVSASNTAGSSDYSAYISATPALASNAPDIPDDIEIDPGTKRLNVMWPAVEWAAKYELYYGTSSNSALADKLDIDPAANTVSATIAGLENGTEYYVWVKAVNSMGSSDFSAPVTGTPKVADVPINFNNYNFLLGAATADFQFGEVLPNTSLAPSSRAGTYQDNLHRSKETPLGNLFTDSVMWYLNEYLDDFEPVDFVFLNSGFINSSITNRSPITVGTLKTITANPLVDDKILILSMKGSDIKSLFNFAAGNAPHMGYRGNHQWDGRRRSSGEWVIVSKEVNYTVEYKYVDKDLMDIGRYLSTGADDDILKDFYYGKVKDSTLKLNGADFDDSKTYRIATTDYLEEEYYLDPMSKAVEASNTGIPYWHAVAEYIYDASSITPGALDGRIKIEGGVPGGPLGVAQGYNKYCPTGATYSETAGCVFP